MGPVLPFFARPLKVLLPRSRYLVVWRLLVGGTLGWLGQWALIAVFVLVQCLSLMPKTAQQQEQLDQMRHELVDWLFKQPYRPRVDGTSYPGIDMSGLGRFPPESLGVPPLWEGLDGVYEFTKYQPHSNCCTGFLYCFGC